MIRSLLLILLFAVGVEARQWMNFTNYLSVECSYYPNYKLNIQLWEHDLAPNPHDQISDWQKFDINEKYGIADVTVTGREYEDLTPHDMELMFQIEHDCTFSRKMEKFVVHKDSPIVVPRNAAGNIRREPSWLLTYEKVLVKPGFTVIGKKGTMLPE